MRSFRKALVLSISILACSNILSQEFFNGKSLSIAGSFGYGKIQYYFDYHPVYILAADQEAVEYSPSWDLRIDKCFYLNKQLDFSIGFSVLTVTEKTHNTAKPSWFDFSKKNLMQGFIHLIPELRLKLPDERFTINFGLRLGTANFIGDDYGRESSNSLGDLNADFSLESGFTLRMTKKIAFKCSWIQGLTKYNYGISMPVYGVTYFKYHTFLAGVRYVIHDSSHE